VVIGEKYFNNNEMITIYGIYKNTAKVKYINDNNFKYLKLNYIHSHFNLLSPIGYIVSSILLADKELLVDDLAFIYKPNILNDINFYSPDTTPAAVKLRLSDSFFSNNHDEYYSDTETENWLFTQELNEILSYKNKYELKIAIYLDTNVHSYISLLGVYNNIYYETMKNSSIKIKEKYNPDYKEYKSIEDLLKHGGIFEGIDFGLLIENEDLKSVTNTEKNNNFGLVMVNNLELDQLECIIGHSCKDLLIMRYWYDINLNLINMDFSLVRNSVNGELLILIYNTVDISDKALRKAFTELELDKFLNR